MKKYIRSKNSRGSNVPPPNGTENMAGEDVPMPMEPPLAYPPHAPPLPTTVPNPVFTPMPPHTMQASFMPHSYTSPITTHHTEPRITQNGGHSFGHNNSGVAYGNMDNRPPNTNRLKIMCQRENCSRVACGHKHERFERQSPYRRVESRPHALFQMNVIPPPPPPQEDPPTCLMPNFNVPPPPLPWRSVAGPSSSVAVLPVRERQQQPGTAPSNIGWSSNGPYGYSTSGLQHGEQRGWQFNNGFDLIAEVMKELERRKKECLERIEANKQLAIKNLRKQAALEFLESLESNGTSYSITPNELRILEQICGNNSDTGTACSSQYHGSLVASGQETSEIDTLDIEKWFVDPNTSTRVDPNIFVVFAINMHAKYQRSLEAGNGVVLSQAAAVRQQPTFEDFLMSELMAEYLRQNGIPEGFQNTWMGPSGSQAGRAPPSDDAEPDSTM